MFIFAEELFNESKSGARNGHKQLPPRADGREEAIAQRKAMQERIEARERERLEEREHRERVRRERSRSPLVRVLWPIVFMLKEVRVAPVVPAKSLDELFKKTKATPSIYWSPLDDAQVSVARRHWATVA